MLLTKPNPFVLLLPFPLLEREVHNAYDDCVGFALWFIYFFPVLLFVSDNPDEAEKRAVTLKLLLRRTQALGVVSKNRHHDLEQKVINPPPLRVQLLV